MSLEQQGIASKGSVHHADMAAIGHKDWLRGHAAGRFEDALHGRQGLAQPIAPDASATPGHSNSISSLRA